MVSISDLSRLSGVSVATVSRALNGYPDVSASTRQRIEDLARQTGYLPSEAARTLVRGRSSLVGVAWRTPSGTEPPHTFLHEVLDALRDELGRRGYDLLLLAPPDPGDGGSVDSLIRRARQMRLAGVVVMGIEADDTAVQALAASDVPTVVLDLVLGGPRTRRITSDNVGGGALAAQHLVQTRRSRLATITGDLRLPIARDRLDGFVAAAAALGLDVPETRIVHAGWHLEDGERAMHRLLARPEPPDAVFAASDTLAIGALMAASDLGVRVPEDIAVVGYDDVRQATWVRPALTTIRQDVTAVGTAAATAILSLSEGPESELAPIVLPTSLVVRASTTG